MLNYIWAILVAFAETDRPVIVHTDSLTIVQQFAELLLDDMVHLEWTHANWWSFLQSLLHQRKHLSDSPLQLIWCPAHLLEHIPAHALTEEDAERAGSTKQDIILNRLADHFAKQHIRDSARAVKAELVNKETDVFARQLWLAKINRVCKKPVVSSSHHVQVAPEPVVQFTARQLCPKWPWDISPSLYTWQVEIDPEAPFVEKNNMSVPNFRTFLRFCASLKWRLGDGFACSVFELAAYAFTQGWRFQLPVGTLSTPQAYACIIRAGFATASKRNLSLLLCCWISEIKIVARLTPRELF